MIFAEEMPPLVMFVTLVGLVAVVFGVWVLFRAYESLAARALQRRYVGLNIHPEPQPGDVLIVFHTYHGVLAWFTQIEHRVVLPPDDARVLLSRLLRFNSTWGLSTPGLVVIPLLAYSSYFTQLRSIAAQENRGGFQPSEVAPVVPPEPSKNDIPTLPGDERPSLFHRIVGSVAAVLSIAGVIGAIASAVEGKFEGVFGGGLAALLLGTVAYEWLGFAKRK